MAREGHLEQAHEHTAIRAIVIGQHQIARAQFDHGRCKAAQQHRILGIGARPTDALIHLRQGAHAEAVAAGGQIDQQQQRLTAIELQYRGPGATHVLHRRERRYDQ